LKLRRQNVKDWRLKLRPKRSAKRLKRLNVFDRRLRPRR